MQCPLVPRRLKVEQQKHVERPCGHRLPCRTGACLALLHLVAFPKVPLSFLGLNALFHVNRLPSFRSPVCGDAADGRRHAHASRTLPRHRPLPRHRAPSFRQARSSLASSAAAWCARSAFSPSVMARMLVVNCSRSKATLVKGDAASSSFKKSRMGRRAACA